MLNGELEMRQRRRFLLTLAAGLVVLLLMAVIKFLRYTAGGVNELLRDAQHQNRRTEKLIVMLDGVSFETMKSLRQRGLFGVFKDPSRVIAPFPSMTNVAAAESWHAEQPQEYESLYFDKSQNILAGGPKDYLRKRPATRGDWHEMLDYVEPKAYEFAVYGFPQRIYQADLRRFLLTYAGSDKKVFRAALKSTDGLAHRSEREMFERSLIEVDRVLERLYRDRQGHLEMIVFSDHGNSYDQSRRVDLASHLRNRGFAVDKRLESEKSVVIPDFGLVNYAALYTDAHNKRPIADAVRQLAEVEIAAFEEDGHVHVLSESGKAQIDFDKRTGSFRYEIAGRDPLQLAGISEQWKDRAESSGEFVSDRLLFDTLKSHRYPDAVFRLYQATTALVKNKADILVSFREGYFWGNEAFDAFSRFVKIRAFHGGLRASHSQAFFMSTAKQAPPYLRSQDLINYF
jgi:hypothetical protein